MSTAPAVPRRPALPAMMPVVPAADAPAAVEPSMAAPVVALVSAYNPAAFIPTPVAAAEPENQGVDAAAAGRERPVRGDLVVDPDLAAGFIRGDDVGRAQHLGHLRTGHADPDLLLYGAHCQALPRIVLYGCAMLRGRLAATQCECRRQDGRCQASGAIHPLILLVVGKLPRASGPPAPAGPGTAGQRRRGAGTPRTIDPPFVRCALPMPSSGIGRNISIKF